MPPHSERIGLKNKNATDSTDSKSLAGVYGESAMDRQQLFVFQGHGLLKTYYPIEVGKTAEPEQSH